MIINFDLMCPSSLFPTRCYVPFGIYYFRPYVRSSFIPIPCYVPFGVFDLLSHSMLCPLDSLSIRLFCCCPSIPLDILSVDVYYYQRFFYFDVFVSESLRRFKTEYVGFQYVLSILFACFAWKVCAVEKVWQIYLQYIYGVYTVYTLMRGELSALCGENVKSFKLS